MATVPSLWALHPPHPPRNGPYKVPYLPYSWDSPLLYPMRIKDFHEAGGRGYRDIINPLLYPTKSKDFHRDVESRDTALGAVLFTRRIKDFPGYSWFRAHRQPWVPACYRDLAHPCKRGPPPPGTPAAVRHPGYTAPPSPTRDPMRAPSCPVPYYPCKSLAPVTCKFQGDILHQCTSPGVSGHW